MSLKFVDSIPEKHRNRTNWEPIVAELRRNPGQWAEIGRYPNHSKAISPQQSLKRREGIETAARTIGDEVVVFARAGAR